LSQPGQSIRDDEPLRPPVSHYRVAKLRLKPTSKNAAAAVDLRYEMSGGAPMMKPILVVLTLSVLFRPTGLGAQPIDPAVSRSLSLFGGAGWMSLWDDETFLGNGALVAVGVSKPIVSHLAVEGEVAWASHHRDAGYLSADGTPLIAAARVLYVFRSAMARVRPFAGAGLGLLHSAGYLTTQSVVRGPGPVPVSGPSVRRDWSFTDPAVEFGAGVIINAGDRAFVRPAFRWTSVSSTSRPRSLLEPPLWMPRIDVTIGWRMRRGGE
jgi:hypothetical protein